MDCIFCKISKKEIPCYKVYETDNVISFLDISPANYGHCLVIPKRHYENVYDITDEDFSEVSHVIKKVSKAIKRTLNPDGINIHQSNGKAAGQEIAHIHFHIIPRYLNDNIHFRWSHLQTEQKKLEELSSEIAQNSKN
jgi:histidine triad (HIT) family protein